MGEPVHLVAPIRHESVRGSLFLGVGSAEGMMSDINEVGAAGFFIAGIREGGKIGNIRCSRPALRGVVRQRRHPDEGPAGVRGAAGGDGTGPLPFRAVQWHHRREIGKGMRRIVILGSPDVPDEIPELHLYFHGILANGTAWTTAATPESDNRGCGGWASGPHSCR